MHLQNKYLLLHHQNVIELWCNGNTTDSGPVILGSNPGSSTKPLLFRSGFLFPRSRRKPRPTRRYRCSGRPPAPRSHRLTVDRAAPLLHGEAQAFREPLPTTDNLPTVVQPSPIYKSAAASSAAEGAPAPNEAPLRYPCTLCWPGTLRLPGPLRHPCALRLPGPLRHRPAPQTRLQNEPFCTRCRENVPKMYFFTPKDAE